MSERRSAPTELGTSASKVLVARQVLERLEAKQVEEAVGGPIDLFARAFRRISDLQQLTAQAVDADWPGYWFHRRILARRLRPVCQVTYSRMARSIVQDGEPVRLTLDSQLLALPARELRFVRDPGLAAITDRMILELKFRGAPPVLFRRLVEEFALTPGAASKYRLGVVASGQAVPRLLSTAVSPATYV